MLIPIDYHSISVFIEPLFHAQLIFDQSISKFILLLGLLPVGGRIVYHLSHFGYILVIAEHVFLLATIASVETGAHHSLFVRVDQLLMALYVLTTDQFILTVVS